MKKITLLLTICAITCQCIACNPNNNLATESQNVQTENTSNKPKEQEESQQDKNNKIVNDQLQKASSSYCDKLNNMSSLQNLGLEFCESSKSVKGSTTESYLGGTDNYEGIIVYQVLDEQDYAWYNLKVILEFNKDSQGNLVPIGYTAKEYCSRKDLLDPVQWIKYTKDNVLASSCDANGNIINDRDKKNKKNKINKDQKSNNNSNITEGDYFKLSSNGELILKTEIGNIPKACMQDVINEAYALKGYRFKEEPYKSRYAKYNGYIDNMDDVPFTKNEKAIMDELSARRN